MSNRGNGTNPHRTFVLFTLFSVALVVFRIFYTSDQSYLYLIWNLFLAWVPLWISMLLHKYGSRKERSAIVFYSGVFVWLVFFPNAPYLVTDFIHFRQLDGGITAWYDLLMLMCFSLLGLLLGFYSLHLLRVLIRRRHGHFKASMFYYGSILLCSAGIYLGRFQRWNSWDLLVRPMNVLSDALSLEDSGMPQIAGFILITFFFLLFVYGVLSGLAGIRGGDGPYER
ncbi:DUF1361 domain-containing protein [Ferviditalea candida]|uniref:DUF1361 domain-containing protein n=1 Tax=Ferviditalea candida TaxID=3108399 RepID=A0ABU5ZCN1_9BACL|nr:DUF1361 domain-containing protein [Paenibacillaceae bacterium T2]